MVPRRDFAPEGFASRFGGKTLLRLCTRLGRGKLVLYMFGESEHNTLGSGPASAWRSPRCPGCVEPSALDEGGFHVCDWDTRVAQFTTFTLCASPSFAQALPVLTVRSY